MKFSRYIMAVDSHTMGEPTRIIVGGLPSIPGHTMAEKKAYLETNLDHLRTAIMLEPRGHLNMFGSVLTQAVEENSSFGIIFMDGGGYLNMCGHGSIGAITVAIQTGIVEPVEPETVVFFDSPAGTIEARAVVENKIVKSVTITNVPSFLYKRDLKIEVPELGEITFDIAFGGSFFAIMPAAQIGLNVETKNVNKLIDAGMKIRKAVNEQVKVQHPELDHINTVDLVEFYQQPKDEGEDYKNVVIFGEGQADRSPCGTGTSAKMATLYARGQLALNTEFIYASIVDTRFIGKLLREAGKVGEFNAVVPEITGSAHITSFNQFVIDDRDPLRHGFILN